MYAELKKAWNEFTSPGQMFEVQRTKVHGVDILAYVHAPNSLRDLWLASAGHGDNDYLVYQDERISYSEAHRRVAAVAQALSGMGVSPGDRVAIAMRNYPEWLLAYWAITSMGAVAVGMNAWWVPHEMEYALQDSAPKVLIADEERLQRFDEIRDKFPAMQAIAVRPKSDFSAWARSWDEMAAGEGTLPEVTIDPDSDACIFYTSGTTGRPKGAQLTHRSCTNNVMNVAFINSVQPRALAYAAGVEPAAPGSEAPLRALVATPLFHVTANNCVAQVATLVGGCLVHMYKWDAGEALRLIEREKVSAFSAVPMMTRELMIHPDFAKRDVSSLKTIGGGGAAMQPDLVGKVPDAMPGTRPNTGYGLTETSGIIAALALEFFLDRPTSVGPAMPTFEAKCIDSEGADLAANEIGELVVRGAPVIKGYLNRPDATAESIVDGWFRTGDIAYIDEDGFIYLVDRAKDMVLRGGENVYCAEVENALFSHDAVAECVVFAVPDERLGEEVGAAIYPRPGETLDAGALREHCKAVVAPFKVPRYIWLLDEPLPRNANGKFVKRALQDSLALKDAV
ncbi:class I adenylate-forming enzyme family protein [Congregibacter litoralis]|uniref:Acyl-CoA synthetase (AMP-forming)/AMP-acid ligase II n=1 Tax=Congregibacter litoralis KT71 TaxID=314285 RepID=A4A400_9GAMM|nr:class I adenylate-forming enzyme family protein [Congregibacter litoralis]EAQ99423.1 Acyl-CoA synthetase (AMP-forming)/AMP-acid ligase II [Congregibacter litoralis KT71]